MILPCNTPPVKLQPQMDNHGARPFTVASRERGSRSGSRRTMTVGQEPLPVACHATAETPGSNRGEEANEVAMRYCGECGSQLEPFTEDGRERRRCPTCGWVWLGSPAPVVLVLAVSEDGRILYTRRHTWPHGAWALVAGFVETGETAEQACLREVLEEVGMRASNPIYLGA